MASRGQTETSRLKANIEEQLNRLLSQLQDLDELRADISEEEYNEGKKDTLDQMKEFEQSLKKLLSGDMTLVSELGSVQLAIQAAVSEAFKTPEILKMFAKKDQGQLRNRLASIQMNFKLGKVAKDSFIDQSIEILYALKKLGFELTGEEESFLEKHKSSLMSDFEKASSNIVHFRGDINGKAVYHYFDQRVRAERKDPLTTSWQGCSSGTGATEGTIEDRGHQTSYSNQMEASELCKTSQL
eukprot:gene19803-23718_t